MPGIGFRVSGFRVLGFRVLGFRVFAARGPCCGVKNGSTASLTMLSERTFFFSLER